EFSFDNCGRGLELLDLLLALCERLTILLDLRSRETERDMQLLKRFERSRFRHEMARGHARRLGLTAHEHRLFIHRVDVVNRTTARLEDMGELLRHEFSS